MVDNLPWSFTESNRIVDAKDCTVADCRYSANQGRKIVDTVNACAKLFAALKAFVEEWDEFAMNQLTDCYQQAREALREIGE